MNYLVSAYSDIGIRKKTNQDSVLVQVAQTAIGNIAFAAVCDGMGGLAKGELASATLIKALAQWFQYEFPQMIRAGFTEDAIQNKWREIIITQSNRIADYGKRNGFNLGTTVTAVLICQNRYYIINVGDSRIYRLDYEITQLTKDQTFVQREIDAGRMTPEEAKKDPQRNVLLQCVGASEYIEPDFFTGEVKPNEVYMLCSDGFRHIITPEEIYQYLNPDMLQTEKNMLENATYLTDLNKYRREDDNISVALIKTC